MVKFDVDGAQNVEVSVKIPCEKSLKEQLEIMEEYTRVHKEGAGLSKESRELNCLNVLYPRMFRKIEPQDKIAGRLDFLPIGFGCVTSLGGVGHYCVFNKLKAFQAKLDNEEDKKRVDALYDYWLDHDLKTIYCKEMLTETTVGRFIDPKYPLIATARLSGMMLDYPKLLEKGIGGLRQEIFEKFKKYQDNEFYKAALGCLDIFVDSAEALRQKALDQSHEETGERKKELLQILLSGVINYGRLDDYLGPYLVKDLEEGRLTEDEAYDYVHSLWTMIENRRTTVNGRIIVGGKGRKNPKEADVFLHIVMKVAKNTRYVESQFTLRFDKDTSDEIWDEALDALGAGATYPTLYNDEVNIPAVAYGMRINEEDAKQYVPFGCTEFVIQGKSTGTPNICMNLLKFLDYYMDLSIDRQYRSYEIMNEHVGFLFTSILMDDCIGRGKALLDGGVKYLGGTNKVYGSISRWKIIRNVHEPCKQPTGRCR